MPLPSITVTHEEFTRGPQSRTFKLDTSYSRAEYGQWAYLMPEGSTHPNHISTNPAWEHQGAPRIGKIVSTWATAQADGGFPLNAFGPFHPDEDRVQAWCEVEILPNLRAAVDSRMRGQKYELPKPLARVQSTNLGFFEIQPPESVPTVVPKPKNAWTKVLGGILDDE